MASRRVWIIALALVLIVALAGAFLGMRRFRQLEARAAELTARASEADDRAAAASARALQAEEAAQSADRALVRRGEARFALVTDGRPV